MDHRQRALLVKSLRVETKRRRQVPNGLPNGSNPERARDPDAHDMFRSPRGRTSFVPVARNSRARIEMARTRSRFQRLRSGETADEYIGRTATGGDSSYGDAAARYDLRRPRRAPPAPTWDDGYTNYDGWANRARFGRGKR